jgi:glycosyltransferase involved in cell wall biosynthesis
MELDRIVFWQPIASPHQHAFLESLAQQFQGEVILAVERSLPIERQAQGWREPTHVKVKVVDISIPANHLSLAAHATSTTLHVFSGFFSHPLVWAGFYRLAPSSARLAIFSESPEQPWSTGWIKRLRGSVLAARWATRFAFVLAIGGVGCEFFERIGFPEEKIVPFGYFLDVPPLADASSSRPADGVVRFISAGQLIRRKGVDLLVESAALLPEEGWTLDIFGDGPQRASLSRRVDALGLTDRVRFRGTVHGDSLRHELATFDRAILPSRFDGWGMLASEALSAGTPVICTDACGAVSLVAGGPDNRVVAAGRVDRLADALADAVSTGPVLPEARRMVRDMFERKGSAEGAAERFLHEVNRG